MKKLDRELLNDKISQRQNGLVASGHIGAGEVIVTQDGEELMHESYGCCKGLIYRLASMTKPVTAVSVLSEVQRGRLSLDDSISKYISGFSDMYVGELDGNGKVVFKEKAQNDITVAMLLNHTNGIMSDVNGVGAVQENAMTDEERQTLESVTRVYERSALSFQPGKSAFYSGRAAFDVAARIVEMTSDMPFDRYVSRYIAEPLGLSDLTFTPSEEQWERMSPMYTFDGHNKGTDNMPRITFDGCPITCFCGGAGLAGSARDYSVFAEMLLNEGTYRGVQILKPEIMRYMKKPYVPTSWNPEDPQWWGLGVRVIVKDYIIPAGSFGWSGAYGTHFWIDTANRVTVVYMKNSRYDGGAGSQTSVWLEQDVTESFK